MSFLKTLATLAVGFAAAKGYDKYKEAGGMSGLKEIAKKQAEPGGAVDQIGQMAEKMGMPGGAQAVKDMFAKAGDTAEGAVRAGQSGMESLIAMMGGAAKAGTEMFEKTFGQLPGGEGAAALGEENAKLMIRAMIMAAKADGTIDEAERARIMDMLGDASPEEIAFVEAELARSVDPMELARAAGSAMKGQVYGAALMAVRSDSPANTAFLDQLASALGLEDKARHAIHAAMGRA